MSMRTHYCGDLNAKLIGQKVTIAGWAHRRRDHGGVIFIDLRDREGLVQIVCDPDRPEMFKTAEDVRGEYLSVYVPTTPNPTSGFFLMVPRGDVINLAMSVDEALKYVISMGVVAPPMQIGAGASPRRSARGELPRGQVVDAAPDGAVEAARKPTG